jgi:cytochrome oxidase assembly protein ShyY1
MTQRREFSMQNLPRAGRWAIYLALAILFAIACAYLSNWQFGRNAWRTEQLALIAQNYDAKPVALDALVPAGGKLDPGDEWRPVRLTGKYLSDQQLLARNRAHGGTAAYEVLVPFQLDDGRVIVVDRGWEPPGDNRPQPDSVPAPPAGEVTVIARLQPGEPLPPSGRAAPTGQVPSINLPLIADKVDVASGDSIEKSAYALMVSESPAPASQPTALEPPSDDPGPYLSYAVQWILFAVMGFVFIGYVIRSELKHRREEAEARAAGREPSPPTPRRRRDRDAADEDAILDAAGR